MTEVVAAYCPMPAALGRWHTELQGMSELESLKFVQSSCLRCSISGSYWDNGNENENYHSILGLYWDNGKENGYYYCGHFLC